MKKLRVLVMFLLVSVLSLAAPIKVGLILAQGGLGDKSFNDSAYAGLMKAKKELNADVKYVEPGSWMEDATYLKEFAENEYDLIIATSYTAQDAMEQLAPKYPKTKFAIVDTNAKEGENIASLVFNEVEGSFLVGALAAKMSKTGKIGFVGALDIPLINRFRSGYEQGARYVNPDIKVVASYVGGDAPFSDPIKGKEHAFSQANQGVDVIYHAAGNTGVGVLDGVKEKEIYGIGVDSDQDEIVKGKILTSMLKNVDTAIYKIIEDTMNGKFEGKVHEFGLKENGVGTTEFKYTKDIIGKENIEFVEKIKKDIINGKIEVIK